MIKILSRVSLLIQDDESKKILSRHLVDIFPLRPALQYGNLYQNPVEARKQQNKENEELDPSTHHETVDVEGVEPDDVGKVLDDVAREADLETMKGPPEPPSVLEPEPKEKETAENKDPSDKPKRQSRRLMGLKPETEPLE